MRIIYPLEVREVFKKCRKAAQGKLIRRRRTKGKLFKGKRSKSPFSTLLCKGITPADGGKQSLTGFKPPVKKWDDSYVPY